MGKEKKAKNNRHKIIIIALIVLLPILSLAIGFYGIQVIMGAPKAPVDTTEKTTKELLEGEKQEAEQPSQEKNTSADETTTPAEEVATLNYTLPSMVTYNIQVGSFAEPANANKKAHELKNNGFGAYVHRVDNYKVFMMSFQNRKQAEVNQLIAAQTYEGAYILEVELKPGTLTYTETDAAYIHQLKLELVNVAGILNAYTQYIHTYDLASFDPDDFSVYLITQHAELTKVRERLMAYEVSNGLKKHHGALIEYLERLENHFQYLINVENPTMNDIWDLTLEIIFDYVNLA